MDDVADGRSDSRTSAHWALARVPFAASPAAPAHGAIDRPDAFGSLSLSLSLYIYIYIYAESVGLLSTPRMCFWDEVGSVGFRTFPLQEEVPLELQLALSVLSHVGVFGIACAPRPAPTRPGLFRAARGVASGLLRWL